MANTQKNRIPDFTLQEIYYHLFQWFVDLGRGQNEIYVSDVLKSCRFQPELIVENGENF